MDGNLRRERPLVGGILLASALLVVLVLWFGRPCFGGWWVASGPTSTDTYMLATIYERWAVQVKGGHLPLWFPEFAGGGYPVHAAWMYGLFYPPIALFLVLPPESAWTWLAVLHIVFGAVGMYAFLWDERRDVAAAASGAIVFALSHFMLSRIVAGHINLVMPFAWTPWVLRAAMRTVRGERGAVGWFALCTAAGLLAGHVQIWFYAAPVVAAYALFEARATGRLAAAWKPLLAGAGVALGITAIQWLPAWELFNVSGHPPEDRSVVMNCSAPAASLVAQLAPRLWSSDEKFAHEFSGLGGPLAVAAVLFAFRLRDPKRIFWFAVLALGLVLAMGLRNPVSEFANALPPLRWARAPGRAMTLVVLAGSVLAAHAVADAFAADSKWRRFVPAAFVASALAVGVPWIDVVKSDFHDFDWSQPLGAAAKEHRVHVLHGRYPYLERFSVRTLRDVCPLDTPGYKALTDDPTPAIAWWFDVGTEIELPWDGPPADEAATKALAARSRVKSFDAMGGARLCTGRPAQADEADESALRRRFREGARVAWLNDPPFYFGDSEGRSWPGIAPVGASAPLTRTAPGAFSVDADTPAAGFVIASEKRYPGWRAEIEGAEATLHTANGTFLAAEVPAGRHRVDFEYHPGWLGGVLALSLGSLAAAVVIVVLGRGPR